jgi:hypothetical protein
MVSTPRPVREAISTSLCAVIAEVTIEAQAKNVRALHSERRGARGDDIHPDQYTCGR